MKTIRALVAFASPEYAASSGQVLTCSDEFAADVIRAGYAEEIPAKPEPEDKPKKTAKRTK